MANEIHIKLILAGSDAISSWRNKNPAIYFDLEDATLRRVDLTYADLSNANLKRANLEWADFRWADLVGADLSDSNLSRADFHKADLSNAKLIKANLKIANFEDANLTNADCSQAIFANTRLLNADLTDVQGLETSRHPKSSTIDQETIDKASDLPVEFLSGCGLSDREINLVYKRLVSSEVFLNFLDKAEYLLSEGYKDAAAVMIGSVLEQNLRQFCQENNIQFTEKKGKKKHISANEMNIKLKQHSIYNQIDSRNIEACLDLRNCAAHGHYNEYTHDQVNNMLKTVLEFIARVKGNIPDNN